MLILLLLLLRAKKEVPYQWIATFVVTSRFATFIWIRTWPSWHPFIHSKRKDLKKRWYASLATNVPQRCPIVDCSSSRSLCYTTCSFQRLVTFATVASAWFYKGKNRYMGQSRIYGYFLRTYMWSFCVVCTPVGAPMRGSFAQRSATKSYYKGSVLSRGGKLQHSIL
jgi:hypothetical protein